MRTWIVIIIRFYFLTFYKSCYFTHINCIQVHNGSPSQIAISTGFFFLFESEKRKQTTEKALSCTQAQSEKIKHLERIHAREKCQQIIQLNKIEKITHTKQMTNKTK